jgi:hypothetical protein
VAMTTHGRSGPSRWVFGSVMAKVLRSATVPLLVVRQPSRSRVARLRKAKKSADNPASRQGVS